MEALCAAFGGIQVGRLIVCPVTGYSGEEQGFGAFVVTQAVAEGRFTAEFAGASDPYYEHWGDQSCGELELMMPGAGESGPETIMLSSFLVLDAKAAMECKERLNSWSFLAMGRLRKRLRASGALSLPPAPPAAAPDAPAGAGAESLVHALDSNTPVAPEVMTQSELVAALEDARQRLSMLEEEQAATQHGGMNAPPSTLLGDRVIHALVDRVITAEGGRSIDLSDTWDAWEHMTEQQRTAAQHPGKLMVRWLGPDIPPGYHGPLCANSPAAQTACEGQSEVATRDGIIGLRPRLLVSGESGTGWGSLGAEVLGGGNCHLAKDMGVSEIYGTPDACSPGARHIGGTSPSAAFGQRGSAADQQQQQRKQQQAFMGPDMGPTTTTTTTVVEPTTAAATTVVEPATAAATQEAQVSPWQRARSILNGASFEGIPCVLERAPLLLSGSPASGDAIPLACVRLLLSESPASGDALSKSADSPASGDALSESAKSIVCAALGGHPFRVESHEISLASRLWFQSGLQASGVRALTTSEWCRVLHRVLGEGDRKSALSTTTLASLLTLGLRSKPGML
eukprot:4617340-Amphidinium_carterae.1